MITVIIAKDMLDHAGHECLVGERIIKSLKKAGIPAEGFFALRGVKKGTLLYSSDEDIDGVNHKYTWTEDTDDVGRGKPVRTQLKNGAIVFKTGRHAEDDEL